MTQRKDERKPVKEICAECREVIPPGDGRYLAATKGGQICLACHDKKK